MGSTTKLTLSVAECTIVDGAAVVTIPNLASCIGLVLHDSKNDLTGFTVVMLPSPLPNQPVTNPAKFASTAVASLAGDMSLQGADKSALKAYAVGGATTFVPDGGQAQSDLGSRNTEAVKAALKECGLALASSAFGGTGVRTLRVDTSSGEIRVKDAYGNETLLATLKSSSTEAAA